MIIPCPLCGARDASEFSFGGEAHVKRPGPHDVVSDDQWATYLFEHDIKKGWQAERWVHLYGCRQWFNLMRNTLTHEVGGANKTGEPRPACSETNE